jgi:hypothetical protein
MHEPEDQQPQVAAAQQPTGHLDRRAGVDLPPEQLDHPVAEQEGEHRVDPGVDEGDDQYLDGPVQHRALVGMDGRQSVSLAVEVPGRVRQHDHQQHETASQVRGQGALFGPDRTPDLRGRLRHHRAR